MKFNTSKKLWTLNFVAIDEWTIHNKRERYKKFRVLTSLPRTSHESTDLGLITTGIAKFLFLGIRKVFLNDNTLD